MCKATKSEIKKQDNIFWCLLLCLIYVWVSGHKSNNRCLGYPTVFFSSFFSLSYKELIPQIRLICFYEDLF